MPEQPKKDTNATLVSDPNWKPPTPAIDSNWVPPTQPFDPDAQDLQNRQEAEAKSNENPIRRGFEWANKPIVDLMSPKMKEITEEFGHARASDTETQAQMRGFLSGGMQGLSDFMSFQTAPIGLGLAAATAGASGAQNAANAAFNTADAVNAARYGKLASTLQRPGQIAGAGMVGHGLFNAYNDPDWIHKLGGLSEAAMGGAGLAHLAKGSKIASTDLITGKPVVPMGESGPGVYIEKHPDMIEPGVKVDPELRYTAENLGKAGKILKDFGYNLKGMSGRQIISLADDLMPGVIPRTVKIPTENIIRQPKLKITDYWIDDPNNPGKKILNPKYQVKGLTTEEPAVEAQKKRQGQIPYFIEDKETGEIKRNPDHPDFKGTEKKINITNEGPEQARALGGKGLKIGTNIEGAIGELTTGYSAPIESMMVREGMQNAIDAVKHLGENGQITIHFDHVNKLISIADNGNGMTRHQLQTLMSDLNKSGKADDPNATGGKGVGKATYMLGGDYFSLSTVTKMRGQKVRFRFGGTPVEIAKGTDIPYEVVPNDTPTGTVITTKLKDSQNSHNAGDMWDNIRDRSRDLKAKVTSVEENNTKNHEFRSTKDDVPVTDTTIDGNGIKVTYRADAKLQARSGIYADVLNNGIYQYSTHMGIGFPAVPNMPDRITIDIHPSAKEGTTAYPFPTQRESLKNEIQGKIDREVRNDLVEAELKRQKERLIKLYNALTVINTGGAGNRPSIIFDPGSRMTPEELKFFAESHTIKEIANHIDETVNDAIESVDDRKWRERLEQTGVILSPGAHGIHIPNPATDRSTIGINPFINIENHPPENAALLNIVTQLHEVGHIGQQKGGKGKFSFAAWADNPSLGAYMDTYFKELAGHGNITPGHAEEWLTRLGDIYAAYGPDKFYEATQKYHDIVSDPNDPTRYSPEVQELLQLYKESRRRSETTEDLLSGTGERAEPPNGGKGPIRGDDKANAKRFIRERRQPKPEIVDKLIEALKNAGAKRLTQDEMYSVERATRIGNANKADTGGLHGFYKQLRELKGELPKVDFERTRLNMADVNDLINAVGASPYLMGYEKIRAKMGLLKMLSAKREELPQPNELALLHQVFGDKFNEVIKMHGGLGSAGNANWQAVKDVAGMQKSLMASMDMSALFRQGGGLMLEPKLGQGQLLRPAWKKNIWPMMRMFKNKQYFNAAMQSIKDDPLYVKSKEAGLKLTGLSLDPNSREESFPSQLANSIPGVAGSERAYVGFLNKARFDTFKSLLIDAQKAGLHPEDVKEEIANFVNVASGRGTLPGKMDRIATDLNAVFFSPRLIASRLQMMNPQTYIKASPFVRRQYINSMLGTASAGLTMTGLMSMLGAKTYTKLSDDKGTPLIPLPGGTDMFTGKPLTPHGLPYMPIDADFGKSRFGNTRMEGYQGYLPYLTYMGRMMSGERESSTTGKMYILGKGFATPNRLNITEDFVSNKFSPAASLAYKILKQKDPQGKEYQFSPTVLKALEDISKGDFTQAMKNAKSGEVVDTFIPMFLGDLAAILKDDPEHFPAVISSFFGGGLQTYGKTPPKTRSGLNNLGMPPMR